LSRALERAIDLINPHVQQQQTATTKVSESEKITPDFERVSISKDLN
jgi:hypothetical protein